MANNQQREELHKTIWAIADELRGSMDGWDFKSYVLGSIFYRFISEDLCDYVAEEYRRAGISDFNYATLSDEEAESARENIVGEKGYFILPSQLFENVCRNASSNPNLNDTLYNNFRAIEGSANGTPSENDLKGLFSDFIVNDVKLGATVADRNKRLAKVLNAIQDMDLGCRFGQNKIDAFGDAYEYLMTMYASAAGKSGGEFFTPQEVSEVLAEIAAHDNPSVKKVYDPACGSGSLLMKFAKIVGQKNESLQYFGQEVNPTTYNLCRINMFLHHINYDNFDIQLEDTLIHPQHMDDAPFDAIVSNPPYSLAWEGKDNPLLINDPRFAPAGVLAPKSAADLGFTMHMLYHLSESGTAAIVEFPGVLYRGRDKKQDAEKQIRQYLLENNFVDTVIQLPDNLFFTTNIATCVIVLRKGRRPDTKVLFVDASKLYKKEGKKNILLPEHQQAIVDAYKERKETQYFTKLVECSTIIEKGCDLSVSSWVERKDTREKIDIVAVNAHLRELVTAGNTLRQQVDEIVKNL